VSLKGFLGKTTTILMGLCPAGAGLKETAKGREQYGFWHILHRVDFEYLILESL